MKGVNTDWKEKYKNSVHLFISSYSFREEYYYTTFFLNRMTCFNVLDRKKVFNFYITYLPRCFFLWDGTSYQLCTKVWIWQKHKKNYLELKEICRKKFGYYIWYLQCLWKRNSFISFAVKKEISMKSTVFKSFFPRVKIFIIYHCRSDYLLYLIDLLYVSDLN